VSIKTQDMLTPLEHIPGDGGPIRILHVLNCLGRGGAEFGVLKLIEGLGAEFEHRLCTTRWYDPDFVRAHHLEKILYVAGSFRQGLQFPLFRLKRIFQRYRPHIVHTRNWGAMEAIPAARLAGVPIVIHSEHGYEVESLGGFPHRQRLFRRIAYAMANRVFAVSQELREFHSRQAWMRPNQISVIYNGVDTKRFSPSAASRQLVRQEFGFPSERLVIGAVGRLVPIKDYSTLLKATARLRQRGINLHLLLVGEGPERKSLQAQESALLRGRITFVGASDRIPELLNAMDIFVLPSFREGMSNTLLEAMACGLPILATRVGGNPEVVDDGSSGWLFSPGDVEDLAKRLEALAAKPEIRRALGDAARMRARTVFGLDGMIERYRSLYLHTAQHRRLAPAA
jgi:sugar transferase (PEP-CTERM/EpsH1 system associated)